jgi:hypothetical protein
LTCDPDTTDSVKQTQRPTIRFRRSGEPLVTTAAGNVVSLHKLHLIPRRDPLSRLERARDELRDALVGILGPSAASLLDDLDEAIALLKRESEQP